MLGSRESRISEHYANRRTDNSGKKRTSSVSLQPRETGPPEKLKKKGARMGRDQSAKPKSISARKKTKPPSRTNGNGSRGKKKVRILPVLQVRGTVEPASWVGNRAQKRGQGVADH